MRRIILLPLIAILGISGLSAFDVNETELSSTKNTSVEFVNYEGPHSKIETLEEIMGIGIYLGEAIAGGARTATYAGKYRVIHAVGDSADEGLDADIFIILSGAEVDHIRNMRYMLAGFFMAAYSYGFDDALLLGEFVTIYNAVYRGKMDFFGGKYKMNVTRNLTADGAGISTVYTDWAGKTEMVIPLSENLGDGGLAALDTDSLTDKNVIDEMRTQPDMGLDSRKDITELKEREVEQKQDKLDEERQAVDEERSRIEEERNQIVKERERVDRQQQDAETDSQRAGLDRQAAALDEQGNQLDQQEEALNQREQELAAAEQDQAERVEQIQQERQDIVTDELALREREADGSAQVTSATGARGSSRIVTFLEVRTIADESLGRIVQIDSAGGTIERASTINSIRNQTFLPLGPSYVVVAGTMSGQGAVRLMTIDQESLETGREGTDDLYEGSFLLVDGSSVYAITGSADTWKIGKFDTTLSLKNESDIEVFQDTSLTYIDDTLYVVGADGFIHSLSAADLTDQGTVQ